MNDSYRTEEPKALVGALQRAYIRWLGVPEIGFRLRALHFRRALRYLPLTPRRVLDAGSGIGAYSVFFAPRFPAATVIGCDIDETKTAFCNRLRSELRLSNLEFVHSDVTRLDLDEGSLDLIVCIDVLEHVNAYQAALSQFHQDLRPGGFLYLHTPQIDQRRLLKRFDSWRHDDHVREGFSPVALVRELEAAGFRNVNATETFGVVGKLAWELNHLTLG